MSAPATRPVRLPRTFLSDASPVFDDARAYDAEARHDDNPDEYLLALAPVVALIDEARAARDGSVTIHVDQAGAEIIAREAGYRAEEASDQAAEAWDASERMPFFSAMNSHRATAKRARRAAAELAAIPVEAEWCYFCSHDLDLPGSDHTHCADDTGEAPSAADIERASAARLANFNAFLAAQ